MNKQILLLSALALFFAVGCGPDKNSNDACLYETTMNLDKGNYEAVVAPSSCANSMHKGAAYFGKAGYDVTTVINNFSSTASTSATQSDLSVYMSNLTGEVTEDTLGNLNLAVDEYGAVADDSEHYKDAQFYLSIVEAVKSLSLIKIVVGTLSSCNINGNTVIDDADAASCALLTSAGQSCNSVNATSVQTSNITITSKTSVTKPGNYKGVTITVAGTDTELCPSPKTYKKLLYQDSLNTTGGYSLATTSNEMCDGSDGNEWPCPIVQNGQPLDLVTAIDNSITSAINSMGEALPAGTSADVQQSISDIKKDACGVDLICTSADLASYLQTL